jgi:hypothetical protein
VRLVFRVFLIGLLVWMVAKVSPSSFLSGLRLQFNGTQYAASVFGDRVPIGRVLASGTGYASGPDQASCWVAVVELAPDAPSRPPRVPVIEQDSARFGGSWRSTPLTGGPPLSVDILTTCGVGLDPVIRKNLEEALSERGSFVISDWKNDVLQVYAPERGIAAHLLYK